jgi:mono/diheme cytochrome c family protein
MACDVAEACRWSGARVEGAMRVWGSLILGAVLTLLVGCGGGEKKSEGAESTAPASPASATEAEESHEAVHEQAGAPGDEAREEAQKIFSTRCFTCHGAGGTGDGPGSAALTPKPRNFTDATWQASVTDDHIAKIIQFGGAAVGKSPAMPGNPDLMSKPEVVQALVAKIRSLSASH